MNASDQLHHSLDTLNAFDWFLLAVLAYSTVSGLLRGLLRTIMGLAGIVAGFLLARVSYAQAGDRLAHWIHPAITARIVMFLLIQGLVMALFLIVGRMLRRAVKAIGLGSLDRLLGALLGVARGVLLAVAAIMVLMVVAPGSDWILHSTTSPYFLQAAHGVSFDMPHDLEQRIFRSANGLKHETLAHLP